MYKNKFKFLPIIYAISMILFFLLAYLFINAGIKTKTKIFVNYQEKSNTNYRVTLHPNNIYSPSDLSYNNNYITKLVDDLIVSFNYKNHFSEVVSGYYKYYINTELIIYDQSINNPLIRKEKVIQNDKYIVLNDGNLTNFSLNDNVIIDFDSYLSTYEDITKKYNLNVLGNLIIKINFYEFLGFSSLQNDQEYESKIIINIPISDTIFKLKINEINNKDKFYEYSKNEDVNYFSISLGLIFLAVGISFLVLVIYTIKNLYIKQKLYKNKLDEILSTYDSIIIKTNKFYNFKNYNLIYVTSFKELLEVYQEYHSLIIYKEINKYQKGIFVIIKDDFAWIYQMKNK